MGVFDRIFANFAEKSGPPDRVMIDSAHFKSHLTAASLLRKGDSLRLIGRTKGGLTSKLHAVCDGAGRPVIYLLAEGQMSDHKGAGPIYPMLPEAETLIADKGYDRDNSERLSPDATSRLAFHCEPSAGCRQSAATLCIDSPTRSRTRSQS